MPVGQRRTKREDRMFETNEGCWGGLVTGLKKGLLSNLTYGITNKSCAKERRRRENFFKLQLREAKESLLSRKREDIRS